MNTIPVITKYNNSRVDQNDHYIWVYAEDISTDHAPVLDWQSGLENLEQLHTEPVEPVQKKQKQEEKCCIVVIPDDTNSELEGIMSFLDKVLLKDVSSHIKGFLQTKNVDNLLEAIGASRDRDLVSHYKLKKIAEKLLSK
jgi:hypothetical protein